MAQWTGGIDEHGRLSAEVTCRQCGYNLNGLSPTGMCPECGLEIAMSLQSDRLAFADPQWVDTLAKGAKLLAWWLILSIVLGMVLGGVLEAVSANDPQVQAVAQSAFALVGMIITVAAVWWLTTPEPREWEQETSTSRTLARYGYAAALVFSVLALAALAASPVAASVGDFLSGLCSLVGIFALFVYMRRLALRIPDESLAKQTWIVMWGLVITMGIAIVALFVAGLSIGFSSPGSPGPGGGAFPTGTAAGVGVVACVLGVAFLVFGIWAIVLAFQYSSRFRRAAEMASRNDASPAGAVMDEPWNRGLS